MKILLDLGTFFVTFVALIKAVDLFIKSTTKIAHHFKISGYTISFFLVAVATSLPEMLVAVNSGFSQNSILSFGTAMGSNIALLTLVVAIPILAGSKIPTRNVLASKDVYFMAFFSILPIALGIDGALNRFDGLLLLISYAVYTIYVLKPAKGLESFMDDLGNIHIRKQILLFVLSLLILLASSQILVQSAIDLSIQTKLGLGFIGLSLTAVGTSLPEIAYTIGNAKKGRTEEILGDILGSVAANSTLVLGIAAVTFPIQIRNSTIGMSTFYFYILIMLVFLRFARTKQNLDKLEALILLIFYVLFIISEIYVQSGINL